MEIDIIDYTAEQLAALKDGELEKVRAAQRRKNNLRLELDKRLREEKERLMDNGLFLSNVWSRLEGETIARYEAEVAIIKESLLFYLHYANDSAAADRVPPADDYPVDYTLSVEDRMIAIRDYYTNKYSDPTERFNAFHADEFAKSYLGEAYGSLWHYFNALKG